MDCLSNPRIIMGASCTTKFCAICDWLNVLQQWGGTGGSGAALAHFEETGRQYPLAVKLGTITPYGADVYSYAPEEDDMVTDPLLAEHLSHWGINMIQVSSHGYGR